MSTVQVESYPAIIGGERVNAGQTFEVLDPSTPAFTEGHFSEKDEPCVCRALRETIRLSLSYQGEPAEEERIWHVSRSLAPEPWVPSMPGSWLLLAMRYMRLPCGKSTREP
jgi:hypothetical protein